MIRSREMAQRMYDRLDDLRWHTSVPTRLNEFAILFQVRLWRSQVAWFAHEPPALEPGLSEQIAADLNPNKRPEGMKPDEDAMYDLYLELSTRHAVSDETSARAKAVLGEQGAVDLTALTGTCVTVAMLLSRAEEGVPARQGAAVQARRAVGQRVPRGWAGSKIKPGMAEGGGRGEGGGAGALRCQCRGRVWSAFRNTSTSARVL
jgi:hypothetical protein